MVVHPGHCHFSGTLVNALAHHLGISQGADAQDERMGVLVHRIDKDTSGLLVVALLLHLYPLRMKAFQIRP